MRWILVNPGRDIKSQIAIRVLNADCGNVISNTNRGGGGNSRPWPRLRQLQAAACAIYLAGSGECKASLANRMRIDRPRADFMHTPMARERGWYEQSSDR